MSVVLAICVIVMVCHGDANRIAVHRISLVSHQDFFVFAFPSAPFLFGS